MPTTKDFVNIPNKTVWIIAFRIIADPLDKVQFHPNCFDNILQANEFIKNNFNTNFVEVLDVTSVKVPDLQAAMDDFDRNLEEVMEENANLTRVEALEKTREKMKDTRLGGYFISTPYIDAYNCSDSYQDDITFTQFTKMMLEQATTWEKELNDRLNTNATMQMPLYENEKVLAFGRFNDGHYVFTTKLIKVNKEDIHRDWDIT